MKLIPLALLTILPVLGQNTIWTNPAEDASGYHGGLVDSGLKAAGGILYGSSSAPLTHAGICVNPSTITTPSSGVVLFCDSTNSNHLSYKTTTGSVVDVQAGGVSNPVTAAAVVGAGAMVVGDDGARGVTASTLAGVLKYTFGVPAAIGTSSTNCVHEDGSSGACGGGSGTVSAGGIYYSSTMLADENLYTIFSVDGITWNFVSPTSVWTPTQSPSGGTQDTGVRDPDIANINGSYWVVYNNTSGAGSSPSKSISLINAPRPDGAWSWVTHIDLSSIGATIYAWSPRWVQDTDASWHVIVAVGTTTSNFQFYEVHPTDTSGLTTWSAPVLVTGTSLPAQMIDPFPMIPATVTAGPCSGKYVMFYEDHNSGSIGYMCSTSFLSGYTVQVADVAGLHASYGAHEGPTLILRDATHWRLYYDLQSTTSWYYIESTDWSSWSAQVNLTQLNGSGANIGVLYPKPRRAYDFTTIGNILAAASANLWSVPKLTGTNAANQIAYFSTATTLTSDSGNMAWNGGGISGSTVASGNSLKPGGALTWQYRDNPSCAGGTVAPSGGYGYHRIALTNTASCAITLPTNADMTQAQVILCNGSSTATISLTWSNAVGGLAAGGTINQCAAQTFLYDSTKAMWYAVGGGSGWY